METIRSAHSYVIGGEASLTQRFSALTTQWDYMDVSENCCLYSTPRNSDLTGLDMGPRWFFSQVSRVRLMKARVENHWFSRKRLISGVRGPGSKSQLQIIHMTLTNLVKFSGPPFPCW